MYVLIIFRVSLTEIWSVQNKWSSDNFPHIIEIYHLYIYKQEKRKKNCNAQSFSKDLIFAENLNILLVSRIFEFCK